MVKSRRDFLARGVELASTLPLAGLLVYNFLDSRSYYVVNSDKAVAIEKPAAIGFCSLGNEFAASLENLCRAYKDEYYVTTVEPSTCINADGEAEFCLETTSDWEEPNNVPDHSVVFGWRDQQKKFQEGCLYLSSKPIVDGSRMDQITVDKKHTSKWFQRLSSAGVFGTEIALLLGYEEIGAHFSYNGYRISLSEKVHNINTESQIRRRSFFKVSAALAGAGAAYALSQHNQRKAIEGKNELEAEIKTLLGQVNVSNSESFRRYFHTTPEKLITNTTNYANKSKEIIGNNIASSKVTAAFHNVVSAGEKYFKELERFFKTGVPNELATLTTYGHITRKLDGSSSQNKLNTSLGLVLEGLAVGGTMAAILIPAEYINSKKP